MILRHSAGASKTAPADLALQPGKDHRAVVLEGEAPSLPPCDVRNAQESFADGEAVGTEELQFCAANAAAAFTIHHVPDIQHLGRLGEIVHTRVCAETDYPWEINMTESDPISA